MDVFGCILKEKTYSVRLRIALLILESENCRASEILSAEWKNFFPDDFLILTGSKHSADIVVRDKTILKLISQLATDGHSKIFYSLDYPKLYRVVKAHYSHLFKQFRKGKNYKVTHGFRYLKANKVNDAKQVKSILHHNSLSSGSFYNPNIPRPKK